MTEYGAPWDGVLTGDANVAPYSAAEWARIWQLMFGSGTPFPNYGVFPGSGDGTNEALRVLASGVPNTQVNVQIGAALVNGRFYETTAIVTLTVASNGSGNPRIDTVILRLDFAQQTIRLALKQGTPAGSPVHPSMQQDNVFWEIPIADIAVANGFSTIIQANIAQRQRMINTSIAGWQTFAYQVGFPTPSSPTGTPLALTPAQTVLLPISLTANMIIHELDIQHIVPNGTAYQWGWDIYRENTNDGATTENTITRVASSNGDASGVSPGAGGLVLAAQGGYAPLTPGFYWLAIQNRHASNNFTIEIATSVGYLATQQLQYKVTTNPNGNTLDAVTGWTKNSYILFALLRGRVFGQSSAY